MIVDLLGDYQERVQQATHGQDMRCGNSECQLYGVLLEVDEIEVLDGDEPCCSACRKCLVQWNSDQTT